MDVNTVITEDLKPTIVNGEPDWPQVDGVPKHLCGPIQWDHPCAAHLLVQDHQIVTPRTRKKVCIVGYAENSRHMAWYDDPDCEIWGVNQLYRFIPRADRWFQLHENWDAKEYWAEGTDQAAWLKAAQCPIYMIRPLDAIPNSVAYPKDWVKQELKVHEYFTSTIAFMLALAIAEGFEEIGMYGIDLIIGREYFFEKCCVEFYFGIAHARGIAYHLPENSALLWQSHTYGYEVGPNYGFFSIERLQKRVEALRREVQHARDVAHVTQGKLEAFEEMRARTNPETPSREQMDAKVLEQRKEVDRTLNQLYLLDGACQEAQRMHAILDLKSKGGAVSD